MYVHIYILCRRITETMIFVYSLAFFVSVNIWLYFCVDLFYIILIILIICMP